MKPLQHSCTYYFWYEILSSDSVAKSYDMIIQIKPNYRYLHKVLLVFFLFSQYESTIFLRS